MKKIFPFLILFLLSLASLCYAVTSAINSFNAGELSPLLEGRTDVAKYYSGCRTMENFLIYTYGGATKRLGTKYIADVNDTAKIRLIPFEKSIEDAYIIEAGNCYMRFYRDQ